MITDPNRPVPLLLWLTLALAGCAAGTSSGDEPGSSSSAGVAGSGNTGGEVGGSGGEPTGGSGGATGGTGGTAELCGNGVVDAGESCDIAIPAGSAGACPASCSDGDPCTDDLLSGAACTAACDFPPVAASDGDGCCPAGQDVTTDTDCQPLYPDWGSAVTVCPGSMHVPTVVATGGGFAVGCMINGNQNETPVVKQLDGQGNEIASHSLLLSDGYYYTDIQVAHHDGRLQVLYQYNCDDNGSWNVGWGWGCIDFREYDAVSGGVLTPSLVFGETGHNGHPVLDYSGTSFGVAWVSYDDVYFREINAARQLVGGGPLDNLLVGPDPYQGDDRDAARTKIAFDGSGYGIFSIMSDRLFFARVNASGSVLVPLTELTDAYSQTFGGQFAVVAHGGAYFAAYRKATAQDVVFSKIDQNGALLFSQTVISGADNRFPGLYTDGAGRFYVLANDSSMSAVLTVFDDNGSLLAGESGPVGDTAMAYPVAARDPATGDIAVAYLDPGWSGQVMLRRFTQGP